MSQFDYDSGHKDAEMTVRVCESRGISAYGRFANMLDEGVTQERQPKVAEHAKKKRLASAICSYRDNLID